MLSDVGGDEVPRHCAVEIKQRRTMLFSLPLLLRTQNSSMCL